MNITFLGTGTPFPDPQRGSSAILVELGSAKILLDCGRDCIQQMARMGISPMEVTHCFLTHSHYDHIADYALLVLTSWRFGRKHTLQVYGPAGTKALSDALFNQVYKIDIEARKSLGGGERGPVLPDITINVTELRHNQVAEGEKWRIRAVEVVHWPIPVSLGFLIEGDGKRVFFTGDTAPCDAVRDNAAGVDLLIHEAMYFPDGSGHYRSHSHPEKAGEIARQAGVSRLVLTHLQPSAQSERLLNDAGKHFLDAVTIATDQLRLVV